ncbi:MAG: 50S ribosomal protein L25, partial [bacterium (Candidatus Stahlbacteria) CG23_combo_of_CG06-09_8_20_14_all_40_9]
MKTLKIEKRDKTGKSETKRLRKDGKIPVIIYGHGEETDHAIVSKKDLKSYLHEHKEEIIKLGAGKGKNVVVKEIQYDPITEEPIHIDFMHIHKDEKLKISIPVILDSTPVGVKEGGILEQWVREVEIECLPKDIPNEIRIDVGRLKIGESLHIKDLSVGEGVNILLPPEEAFVSVMPPR